jgi:hypothetical protein
VWQVGEQAIDIGRAEEEAAEGGRGHVSDPKEAILFEARRA